MKEPIFVKTKQHFWECGDEKHDHSRSYTDFWRLVELSGFLTIPYEDVRFDSVNVYIFTRLDGMPKRFPKKRKARLIHWELERPSWVKAIDERFDETWVSDRYYATLLPGARYVTLGTDPMLRQTWSDIYLPKVFDFIHLSYLTDRRKRVINSLQAKGFKIAPNSWGNTRELNLLQSKAMLNIHQDDHSVIEPLRFALASPFGLPILTEKSEDYYPWEVDTEIPMPAPLGLVWLKPKNPMDEDYQFKKLVLEAVNE